MLIYNNASIANFADKFIFITGGTNARNMKMIKDVRRYDINMNQWSEAPKMNFSRRDHASCALGEFLYVIFGQPNRVHNIERLKVEDV